MRRLTSTRLLGSSQLVLVALATLLLGPVPAEAQRPQVVISTPHHNLSDSYFENIGVNWGANWRGGFFNFGGGGAAPPFGNFDPAAGARFGLGFRGGGGSGFFNLAAGQGSNRTFTSTTPSLTVMNGVAGSIANTIQRPFVTGIIPVVGQQQISPLAERLRRLKYEQATGGGSTAEPSPMTRPPSGGGSLTPRDSTANRGDLSLAEIARRRDSRQQDEQNQQAAEIEALLQRAAGSRAAGKSNVAKIYYKRALKLAKGEQRTRIARLIDELP